MMNEVDASSAGNPSSLKVGTPGAMEVHWPPACAMIRILPALACECRLTNDVMTAGAGS